MHQALDAEWARLDAKTRSQDGSQLLVCGGVVQINRLTDQTLLDSYHHGGDEVRGKDCDDLPEITACDPLVNQLLNLPGCDAAVLLLHPACRSGIRLSGGPKPMPRTCS